MNISQVQMTPKISVNSERISAGFQSMAGQILKIIIMLFLFFLLIKVFSQWHNSDSTKGFNNSFHFDLGQKMALGRTSVQVLWKKKKIQRSNINDFKGFFCKSNGFFWKSDSLWSGSITRGDWKRLSCFNQKCHTHVLLS